MNSSCALAFGPITNGSLMDRPGVRRELSRADWVSVKVDSVVEEVWHEIDADRTQHGREDNP